MSHGHLLEGADKLLIKPAGWGQAGIDAPADESFAEHAEAARSRASQTRAPIPILAAIATESPSATLTDHAVAAPISTTRPGQQPRYTTVGDSTPIHGHDSSDITPWELDHAS